LWVDSFYLIGAISFDSSRFMIHSPRFFFSSLVFIYFVTDVL
jgi:hypothetical protein